MRLANQVTDGTCLPLHRVFAFAKIEQGVGGAAPAEFVVQASQRDIVANTSEFAFVIDDFLGHNKKRNTAGSGDQFAVWPGDLGEHQMNDVVGEFVLAGGYPHLVALEAVTRAQRVAFKSCAIRRGFGGDIAQR